MGSIIDRVTVFKAVRAELSISLSDGKDVVDAAFRGGLGTRYATQRNIEEAIANQTPDGKVTETAALLLDLVPTPADPFAEPSASSNPTDVAQAAVLAWLNAAGVTDDTVVPYPGGRLGSTLTVGDLRCSIRSAPSAG